MADAAPPPSELSRAIKAEAVRLGFALCGICPAVTPRGLARLDRWLEAAYDGEMTYLRKRRAAYEHPRRVLDGTRSLVVLGMNYQARGAPPLAPGRGRVSRYAWGADYHDVIHGRLRRLIESVRRLAPGATLRGVVDTAPLLEREFAQLAGLGWIGKNTMLIHPRQGSWFFLAAVLTDLDLPPDAPYETDHCGTCRACLDACPTGAFPVPYVLNARRCISYLTIELRGPIPREFRTKLGDWVFGCDICQEVCPWNRHAPITDEQEFQPTTVPHTLDLTELFSASPETFRKRFRRSALWRAKRQGLLRNAAIALGNQPSPDHVAPLQRGLRDEDPVVRGACAWALGRLAELGFPVDEVDTLRQLHAALRDAERTERDQGVLEEIHQALEIIARKENTPGRTGRAEVG